MVKVTAQIGNYLNMHFTTRLSTRHKRRGARSYGMDDDPNLWAAAGAWLANRAVSLLVGTILGSLMTFFVVKWLLGKAAIGRIESLERDRDDEKKKGIISQAANATRLSIVEAQLRAANQSSEQREKSPASKDDPLDDIRELWRDSHGSGRLTSKLVMMLPALDEVRDVFSAHRAAPKRDDVSLANWAFLYRLEDEGQGNEVFSTAYDFLQGEEEVDIDPSTQNEFIRLREEWRFK